MQFIVTVEHRTPMLHMMRVYDEKFEKAAKKYARTFSKRSSCSGKPVVYVAKFGKEIQRMKPQDMANWLGESVYDGTWVLAHPTKK